MNASANIFVYAIMGWSLLAILAVAVVNRSPASHYSYLDIVLWALYPDAGAESLQKHYELRIGQWTQFSNVLGTAIGALAVAVVLDQYHSKANLQLNLLNEPAILGIAFTVFLFAYANYEANRLNKECLAIQSLVLLLRKT